jgi:phosphoglycolate phosphatase-like HAD superfamily hydrolase
MFEITPQHDFFVAVDSDGCVFDTMELKHKECFIPEFVNHYELQAISKFARECWEFVNLYSQSRGANRFVTLVESLRRLATRSEVQARGVRVEIPEALITWIASASQLGNPSLEASLAESQNSELMRALQWSKAVNMSISAMVRGVPPFRLVRECLVQLHEVGDIIVCSATPNAALRAEWSEHGLADFVADICGQEVGTKKEVLKNAGKYAKHKSLMIGDAPGDFAAAKANECLFFPIAPGDEEASWKRLYETGIQRFLTGTFAGEYQQQLLAEFERLLPENPTWKSAA